MAPVKTALLHPAVPACMILILAAAAAAHPVPHTPLDPESACTLTHTETECTTGGHLRLADVEHGFRVWAGTGTLTSRLAHDAGERTFTCPVQDGAIGACQEAGLWPVPFTFYEHTCEAQVAVGDTLHAECVTRH